MLLFYLKIIIKYHFFISIFLRIAVLTGAIKGIGFEICKQLASNGVKVVCNEAVEKLKAAGYSDLVFHQLDVMDPCR
jgi:NAD(P)-dependent dehydrogenase (short-subunit alcohol dehydrogenase family)